MTIANSLAVVAAAAAAAGHQHFPTGALYVVATPIGNLADLTLRAIHVLALVDAVACEDTRVGGQLLHHLGLSRPLIALHQHNEASASQAVLARLALGQRVACISDAGTPAVCDPGAALVAAATAAGHRVLPIPGASSVVAALSAAGDALAAGQGFSFFGFLPAKGAARAERLAQALTQPGSLVFFEAPHRIGAMLDALALAGQAWPTRRLTLCRELTKQFETIHSLAVVDAPAWLAADPQRGRGEFVLVLHALTQAPASADALPVEAERLIAVLARELPIKQAVALAAEASGAPRNALYARALALRAGDAEATDQA